MARSCDAGHRADMGSKKPTIPTIPDTVRGECEHRRRAAHHASDDGPVRKVAARRLNPLSPAHPVPVLRVALYRAKAFLRGVWAAFAVTRVTSKLSLPGHDVGVEHET